MRVFQAKDGKIEDGREMGWKEMEERIKEVLREVEEREGDKKERERGWWHGECEVKKREVRRELRKWGRGEGKVQGVKKRV